MVDSYWSMEKICKRNTGFGNILPCNSELRKKKIWRVNVLSDFYKYIYYLKPNFCISTLLCLNQHSYTVQSCHVSILDNFSNSPLILSAFVDSQSVFPFIASYESNICTFLILCKFLGGKNCPTDLIELMSGFLIWSVDSTEHYCSPEEQTLG